MIRLFTTKRTIIETKVENMCVNCTKCNKLPKTIPDKNTCIGLMPYACTGHKPSVAKAMPAKEKIDEYKYFIPGAEKGLPLPWQKEY